MTDEQIIKALELCCTSNSADCEKCPFAYKEKRINLNCINELCVFALNLIYRLQADKEALIAGQETLQKAYEALKADEEREHQYCKNVCEPKYKAKIADERAKGDICAAVIARQDKEIECYRTKIERFEKIETAINNLWNEIQKLATFKNKRKPTLEELLEYMENLKDEAIKEFAVRLKSKAYLENGVTGFQEMVVDVRDIDETYDEMVGDNNDL